MCICVPIIMKFWLHLTYLYFYLTIGPAGPVQSEVEI